MFGLFYLEGRRRVVAQAEQRTRRPQMTSGFSFMLIFFFLHFVFPLRMTVRVEEADFGRRSNAAVVLQEPGAAGARAARE